MLLFISISITSYLLTVQNTGKVEETLNALVVICKRLTFRHRASCILGQAFRYSAENAFYIFNQQIHFII